MADEIRWYQMESEENRVFFRRTARIAKMGFEMMCSM
jgi:hypothetical protein